MGVKDPRSWPVVKLKPHPAPHPSKIKGMSHGIKIGKGTGVKDPRFWPVMKLRYFLAPHQAS
jgi:hypothetical protein